MESNNRKPTESELKLINALIKKSVVTIADGWQTNLIVRSMNDDGMGSLFLFPEGNIEESRNFGKQVSEIMFIDKDNVQVIASLYLDEKGNLFELDIWKTDFSKLIEIPDLW